MSKYIYQKFLLECDYDTVRIEDFPEFNGDISQVLDYLQDYSLFDVGHPTIRKVCLEDLDENVDTEEEWNAVLDLCRRADIVVLCNVHKEYMNPIVQEYREATVKAYLYRLKTAGIDRLYVA